jgi:sigma-B regulation protein RsbU (phosphoserine phosphatase)
MTVGPTLILVIEDDAAIRRGLTTALQAESFNVLAAANGDDGYRLVRETHPDLVILDLMLPGMNGYGVCEQMRRYGFVTPVLMLTAQDHETNRVRGFEAGADDYVTKPFSVRELIGRVRAILRRSEGRLDIANQRELDEARQVQQRLMPTEIPQVAGLRIAGACRPARIAGGDYFDVLKLNDGAVAVCIADVCGKGMPAALTMANLQAAVRTSAAKGLSPGEVCESVNYLMCANIAGCGFITFFYAIIDCNAGRKRCIYCNAGHNPPILLERDGDTHRLDGGGGVLGVLRDWKYEEHEKSLAAGDSMLLYTDGITETGNLSGDEFGEKRLVDLLRDLRGADAADLVDRTFAAAAEFTNGTFEDDVTVLAVTVE